MNTFSDILLKQAGVLFLLVFVFLFFVFKTEGGQIKKRSGLFSSFTPKTVAYIFLAAFSLTYCVSRFSNSGLTTALVFVAALGLAPLCINNMRKRLMQEEVFSDVILYCQNMGMLLKQTHNVYSSLEKATEDLSTSFKDDLSGLLFSFQNNRDDVADAMRNLERNYPYSCIRNLDIILLYMFYETSNINDSLLTTYQDDVTALEQDVRKNKEKRKALRMSYIFISLGSILAYWWFVSSIKDTFGDGFDSSLYRWLNLFYVFGTLFAFFFVDRYFNLNTTKE